MIVVAAASGLLYSQKKLVRGTVMRTKIWSGFLGLIVALCLAGCAGPRVEALMPTPVMYTEIDVGPLEHIPEGERWTPRMVYYATTRQREDDFQRIDYGNGESNRVSMGVAMIGFGGRNFTWADLNEASRQSERGDTVDLSIAGLLEIGDFEVRDDGSLVDTGGSLDWLREDLNAKIEAARDQDLLIYVHGAKVNFYNANAFAAQLDHFMGRDMTSLAFSWPTRQNIIAYGSGGDVERAYRSAPKLASLIAGLANGTVARRIHIVCWSAGGRVVTSALKTLHERYADSGEDLRKRFRIGTVYFAAADVPQEEFVEALPALNDLAQRLVVTLSSEDGALRMAQRFMGGGTRIGQKADEPASEDIIEAVLAADHLEVVDVSRGWEGRGFDITGHRYWIDHPWASTDMILAIRSDLGPEERALGKTDQKVLWTIPPDYPERIRELMKDETIEIRRND